MRRIYKPVSWEKDLIKMNEITQHHITPSMYILAYISEIKQFINCYEFNESDIEEIEEISDFLIEQGEIK